MTQLTLTFNLQELAVEARRGLYYHITQELDHNDNLQIPRLSRKLLQEFLARKLRYLFQGQLNAALGVPKSDGCVALVRSYYPTMSSDMATLLCSALDTLPILERIDQHISQYSEISEYDQWSEKREGRVVVYAYDGDFRILEWNAQNLRNGKYIRRSRSVSTERTWLN